MFRIWKAQGVAQKIENGDHAVKLTLNSRGSNYYLIFI